MTCEERFIPGLPPKLIVDPQGQLELALLENGRVRVDAGDLAELAHLRDIVVRTAPARRIRQVVPLGAELSRDALTETEALEHREIQVMQAWRANIRREARC